MTLGDALDAALAPGTVTVEREGVHAEVEVRDLDRLGVSIERLVVRGVSPGLDRLSEALAPLDRFTVVEADPRLGGVLRSPVRREEFYEARTDGDNVSVEKQRIGESGRERVPFTLTREQLGRVVEGIGE